MARGAKTKRRRRREGTLIPTEIPKAKKRRSSLATKMLEGQNKPRVIGVDQATSRDYSGLTFGTYDQDYYTSTSASTSSWVSTEWSTQTNETWFGNSTLGQTQNWVSNLSVYVDTEMGNNEYRIVSGVNNREWFGGNAEDLVRGAVDNTAWISIGDGYNAQPHDPHRNLRNRLAMLKRQREFRIREDTAKAMFAALVDSQQWADWKRYGSIRFQGSLGGWYEVGGGSGWGRGEKNGWQGQVYKLDFAGNPEKKLCCHPTMQYCVEDRVIAIMLAIQSDEANFLQIANEHGFTKYEKERVKARRAFMLQDTKAALLVA